MNGYHIVKTIRRDGIVTKQEVEHIKRYPHAGEFRYTAYMFIDLYRPLSSAGGEGVTEQDTCEDKAYSDYLVSFAYKGREIIVSLLSCNGEICTTELMRRIEETGHGWYLIYRRVAISAAPGESAEQIRKRITDKGIRQCEAEIIKQHPDMAGKLDPLAERIMTRILHRDQA